MSEEKPGASSVPSLYTWRASELGLLDDGKPMYCHNLAWLTRLYVEAEAVEAGEQAQP